MHNHVHNKNTIASKKLHFLNVILYLCSEDNIPPRATSSSPSCFWNHPYQNTIIKGQHLYYSIYCSLIFLQAHCHLFVMKNFANLISDNKMDPSTQNALSQLCKLYAVHGIVENMGEFMQV